LVFCELFTTSLDSTDCDVARTCQTSYLMCDSRNGFGTLGNTTYSQEECKAQRRKPSFWSSVFFSSDRRRTNRYSSHRIHSGEATRGIWLRARVPKAVVPSSRMRYRRHEGCQGPTIIATAIPVKNQRSTKRSVCISGAVWNGAAAKVVLQNALNLCYVTKRLFSEPPVISAISVRSLPSTSDKLQISPARRGSRHSGRLS